MVPGGHGAGASCTPPLSSVATPARALNWSLWGRCTLNECPASKWNHLSPLLNWAHQDRVSTIIKTDQGSLPLGVVQVSGEKQVAGLPLAPQPHCQRPWQGSLPLGVVPAKPMGGGSLTPFQSHTVQWPSESLPIVPPGKEHTSGPCWVRPTVLSARLELGGVVPPLFGGPGWCTPYADAVRIGVPDPGRWHRRAVWDVQDLSSRPSRSLSRATPSRSSLHGFHIP